MKCIAEVQLLEDFFKAKYWPPLAERFLYRDGEEIPEMTSAFFAMEGYYDLREIKIKGGKI